MRGRGKRRERETISPIIFPPLSLSLVPLTRYYLFVCSSCCCSCSFLCFRRLFLCVDNVNVNVNVVGLSIVKWSLPEAAERAEATTSRELLFSEKIRCDNEGGGRREPRRHLTIEASGARLESGR